MSDLSALIRRLGPYIVDVARATTVQTLRENIIPRIRTGQVISTAGRTAQVLMDTDQIQGSATPVAVQCISHLPAVGSRCAVLMMPPAGAFLVGTIPIPFSICDTTAAFPLATDGEGPLAYSKADDIYYFSDGASWLPGLDVGAWTAWTPAFNQNGAKATTVTSARYIKQGKMIIIKAECTCTAAGTAGNAVVISGFPAAPAVSGQILGQVMLGLASAEYHGTAKFNSTNAEITVSLSSYGSMMGIAPNAALANGDRFWMSGFYEVS